MKKHLKIFLPIGATVGLLALIAAVPGPPSTDFTRGLLRTTNAAEAATYLGVTSGGGATNPVNNFYSTNNFYVTGKGNTLVVTQQLTLNYIKTNLLATDASGNVTTAKYGANITWDPATQTISSSGGSSANVNGTNLTTLNLTNSATVTWAVAGGSNVTAIAAAGTGDTTATNIVTLTQTGTNAAQMDFSLVARGGVFKLALTNNAYFGAPANVNNTDFKKAWLVVQQPSTGTCLITFTSAFFAFPEGVAPINDTNNGSVVWYEFVTDPITNGLVHGWMSLKSKLIP
jgi:hypothetical protein